jgi:hypothetical protein
MTIFHMSGSIDMYREIYRVARGTAIIFFKHGLMISLSACSGGYYFPDDEM